MHIINITDFPLFCSNSAQNALFCRQNARLKNGLFCSKFCRQNLSKPTFELKVGGSSQLSAVMLFPWTRILTPHCLPSPMCIKGYHNAEGEGGGGGE